MNAQVRRELLRILDELGDACPNYRLGQMIDHLAFIAAGTDQGAVYNVEDDELLAAARQHLESRRAQQRTAV